MPCGVVGVDVGGAVSRGSLVHPAPMYRVLALVLIAASGARGDTDAPKGHLLRVAGLEHFPHLGVVEECTGSKCPGTVSVEGRKTLRMTGNNRAYLVADARGGIPWDQLKYVRLPLLGGTFAFTADISDVKCNCNAALYLVALPEPGSGGSCYCDITYGSCGSPCVEIDLLESNVEVAQTTVHAHTGRRTPPIAHAPTLPIAHAPTLGHALLRKQQHQHTLLTTRPSPARRTAHATPTAARSIGDTTSAHRSAVDRPTCGVHAASSRRQSRTG